jgi:hypothetical protein
MRRVIKPQSRLEGFFEEVPRSWDQLVSPTAGPDRQTQKALLSLAILELVQGGKNKTAAAVR